MTDMDRALARMAHLDEAARLLGEVRLFDTSRPIRAVLNDGQAALSAARERLEQARRGVEPA